MLNSSQHALTAADVGWSNPAPNIDLINTAENTSADLLSTVHAPALQDIEMPAQKWVWDSWIPHGTTTLLYGDGGIGKSLLALQLMTSIALGQNFFGSAVNQSAVLGVFCEDSEEEIQRRQHQINQAMGIEFNDLPNMHWCSRVGENNLLMTFRNGDMGAIEKFYQQLLATAKKIGVKFIVVDTAADTFGGNENCRPHVRQFINLLTKLAREIDGAVLLCAHPSVAGMASGDGYGGSTAWSNTARSRIYLERPKTRSDDEPNDSNLRVLSKKKANYSAIGADTVLEWYNGAFRLVQGSADDAVSRMEKRARENKVKSIVLECMDIAANQGRPASPTKQSDRYPAKLFRTFPEAQGIRKNEIENALNGLFNEKIIKVDSQPGPDRHLRNVIVKCDDVAGEKSAGSAGGSGASD